MRLTRPALVNGGLAIVIVGAVVGGWFVLNPPSSASADDATQLTSTVQQGTVSNSISASGIGETADDGTVTADSIREGDTGFAFAGQFPGGVPTGAPTTDD